MMKIETERLILRDQLAEDWEDVHEYSSIAEFSQYDSWGPNTREDTQSFVQTNLQQAQSDERFQYDLAVVHKKDHKVIGGIGIRRASELSFVSDLGFAINPRYQSQGLASEAVRAILNFVFDELKLALVYATCDIKNTASFRVMEKCGMLRVGKITKHKEFKGAWHDSYRYEIVNKKI